MGTRHITEDFQVFTNFLSLPATYANSHIYYSHLYYIQEAGYKPNQAGYKQK